eukprot:scaffold5347_cov130-Cylindrotheca_fusiformis.AAC.6
MASTTVNPVMTIPVKLQQQQDDLTISTSEESGEKIADTMMRDADEMIEEIKGYIQGPKAYTPTKREIEWAFEVYDSQPPTSPSTVQLDVTPPEETKVAEEEEEAPSSFSFFFNPFYRQESTVVVQAVEEEEKVATPELPETPPPLARKGVVAQEMVRRLVVRKLMQQREQSAVTIQAYARRMLTRIHLQDIHIIDHPLEVEVAAKPEYLDDMIVGDLPEPEPQPEAEQEPTVSIAATPEKPRGFLNKMLLFKRKHKNEETESPLLMVEDDKIDEDAPVLENKSKKSKWKRKMRKLLFLKKQQQDKSPQPLPESPEPVQAPLPPPPPKRMSIVITTPDHSVPSPEARAEAEAYHKARAAAAAAAESTASQATSSVPPSNLTAKNNNSNEEEEESAMMAVEYLPPAQLAVPPAVVTPEAVTVPSNSSASNDDASDLTTATQTNSMLDTWFSALKMDKVFEEVNQDAVNEIFEMAMDDESLKNDLNLLPEYDWTSEDWVECRKSMLECSAEHYDEVTYQTSRFMSNTVRL